MSVNRKQLFTPAWLALALVWALGSAPPIEAQTVTGTNQIAFSDFDTAIPSYDYGYFYHWGWPASGQYTNGTYLVNRAYNDPLINPTNGPLVIRYDFTNA